MTRTCKSTLLTHTAHQRLRTSARGGAPSPCRGAETELPDSRGNEAQAPTGEMAGPPPSISKSLLHVRDRPTESTASFAISTERHPLGALLGLLVSRTPLTASALLFALRSEPNIAVSLGLGSVFTRSRVRRVRAEDSREMDDRACRSRRSRSSSTPCAPNRRLMTTDEARPEHVKPFEGEVAAFELGAITNSSVCSVTSSKGRNSLNLHLRTGRLSRTPP